MLMEMRMTDNRMKQWRTKLKDKGGAIFQVHLSKTANDRLNALSVQLGQSKKDIVELAIAKLK